MHSMKIIFQTIFYGRRRVNSIFCPKSGGEQIYFQSNILKANIGIKRKALF